MLRTCWRSATTLLLRPVDAEDRDLRPIVQRVVEGCAELAQRQNVRVETVAQVESRPKSTNAVSSALFNLVVNAIEHADGHARRSRLAETDRFARPCGWA